MALSLDLSYCQSDGCKTLTLTDITGEYDVTYNPGGWGFPDLALTDVTMCQLIITNPSNTSFIIDCINDLGIDFSTVTVNTLIYEIPYTLLGSTLSDGIYQVMYTVEGTISGDSVSYTITRCFSVMCTQQCAIDSLIKLIPEQIECNKCDQSFIDKVFMCYMLHKAMQNAAFCGSVNEYLQIKSTLSTLINETKYEL